MRIDFACPSCQKTLAAQVPPQSQFDCPECHWTREISETGRQQDPPEACLVCGCGDLWRRKDFPQRAGLVMVALASVLSTIAWAYYLPVLAIGILLFFLLIDMGLYLFMPDVLVCYRCSAHYRRSKDLSATPYFNLETAERYRQERIRLEREEGSSHPH